MAIDSRLVFAGAAIGVAVCQIGCSSDGTRNDRGRQSAGADSPIEAPVTIEHTSDAGDQSEAPLRAFLNTMGFAFRRTLDASGRYFIVVGNDRSSSEDFLLAVREDAGTYSFMYEPFEFLFPRAVNARWVSVSGHGVEQLILTHDVRSEATPETFMYRIVGDTLATDHIADHPTCMPSVLEDVDGDGELELVDYMPHERTPQPMACSDCQVELELRFGVSAVWPKIRERRDGRWVSEKVAYADYYEELAGRYEAMIAWLVRTKDEQPCKNVAWLEEGDILRPWAEQALQLATARQ